ncbi:MAG: glycosyltransferase [Bacteroidota bacterium]|nr:glycosyltransferase [Bacteroidota bacterium]
MSKYSIILPVRNGGEYVKECVKSILAQSLPDFNLIVLDNCSEDGTQEWLRSLADPRIIIHEATEPLAIEQNWARICTVPKNEFITLIGHDDLLEENYLKEMDDLIQRYPDASLYQAHFVYVDHEGKFIRKCLSMKEVQSAGEFLETYMMQQIDSTGTGYMMRSKDYDSMGGMDPKYENLIYADIALWISLTEKSFKATSGLVTFRYRIHENVSKVTGGQEYQRAFERFLYFIMAMEERDEEIRKAVKEHGQLFLLNYCESLSHRILKTPRQRRTITVSEFVKKCKGYASQFIPGQEFNPEKRAGIILAIILDQSTFGRSLFFAFKKVRKWFVR